ncbi:DUF2220 family protein [Corynebacterium sp. Z-1]|uniref:Wadjet anti-phage system protein JetD domain-containing protein n=1 Tax=Corynebacterium sp. Z-1 TaxID=3074378 RepID=UPI0028832DFD|nr:Wadjet anti-phage system protein JetD domain-containing protein [Corynebacterium sp. Z-1]WNI13228.1 DUF2220 family protein [Corynebacterium sp. Z-1]
MKTPEQVRARAATFYARNHRAWLDGDFSGLTINLQPPTGRAAERDDGLSVRSWIDEWTRSAIPAEWEDKKLGYLGTYSLPARVVLSDAAVAAEAAGRSSHWRRVNELLSLFCHELGEEVRAGLAAKLAYWEGWDNVVAAQFIDVVRWLRTHHVAKHYARELPIFGIDSKWIETRRAVISAVVGEISFREAPSMVELRILDPTDNFCGMRHWSCPVSALSDVPGARVLIVENRQTFLALPNLPNTIAVYGGGLRAHSLVRDIPWLATKELLYWGDLDSHGFYILELVRRHVSPVQSVLMDLDTARRHLDLAVEEPQPSRFVPHLLTPSETMALEFLRSHSTSGCMRIEQERIVFDHVEKRLREIG